MAKSRDAFRTISEVAEWLDTPAHVLRFWESKFAQIKPVKRAGGRRYYRPEDMALLGGIKALLHEEGMTIKGAQKLLREKGIRHVAALSPPIDPGAMRDITPAEPPAEPAVESALESPAAPPAEPPAAPPTEEPAHATDQSTDDTGTSGRPPLKRSATGIAAPAEAGPEADPDPAAPAMTRTPEQVPGQVSAGHETPGQNATGTGAEARADETRTKRPADGPANGPASDPSRDRPADLAPGEDLPPAAPGIGAGTGPAASPFGRRPDPTDSPDRPGTDVQDAQTAGTGAAAGEPTDELTDEPTDDLNADLPAFLKRGSGIDRPSDAPFRSGTGTGAGSGTEPGAADGTETGTETAPPTPGPPEAAGVRPEPETAPGAQSPGARSPALPPAAGGAPETGAADGARPPVLPMPIPPETADLPPPPESVPDTAAETAPEKQQRPGAQAAGGVGRQDEGLIALLARRDALGRDPEALRPLLARLGALADRLGEDPARPRP